MVYEAKGIRYQPSEKVTNLDHPINVMYLIHQALSAQSGRVQQLVHEFEYGESLQPFRSAFNIWAARLMYHADMEDLYMTAPFTDHQPSRVNEEEHAELGQLGDDLAAYLERDDPKSLEQSVKAAILALHDQQHAELMERLEDVMAVLNEEIEGKRILPRTKRHLFRGIVNLRSCMNDHLENEEAFVLPEIKARMSVAEQLKLTKHLLIDEASPDPRTILDWVSDDATPEERILLKELESRFVTLSSSAN